MGYAFGHVLGRSPKRQAEGSKKRKEAIVASLFYVSA